MAVIIISNEDLSDKASITISSGAFEHFMDFIIDNSQNQELSNLAREYYLYHYLELHNLTEASKIEFVRMADEYSEFIANRDGKSSPYSITCSNMAKKARDWIENYICE